MVTRPARVHSLDALRGLLAVGIMTYHLLGWTRVGSVLTLGTYGVYAFFVLSGFALEWAYGEHLREPGGLRRYAAARVARILPLYATAVLASAALTLIGNGSIDRSNLLLNLTLTFGFVNPGETSTVVGGWSIGIEVLFYLLFPAIVWLRLSTRWLAVLAVATLVVRIVWTAIVIPPGSNYGIGWVAYTQLPPFLVFFITGMVGSRLVMERNHREPRAATAPTAASFTRADAAPLVVGIVLLLGVVAATLIGDGRIEFVGVLGATLTIAVLAAVVVTGHARPWRGRAAQVATLLGDLSYGTYILHPILWRVLTHYHVRGRTAAIITFVVTPLLALAVHRLVELPVGRWIRSTLGPARRPKPALAATTPADPA